MNKRKKKKNGFTLIETMVAVVIFTVVMSLALAIFLSVVRNQRFALQRQKLISETSHALYMAKNALASGEETEENIESFIKDMLSMKEEGVILEKVSVNGRTTLLLQTTMKVDEENEVSVKLQTTTLKR